MRSAQRRDRFPPGQAAHEGWNAIDLAMSAAASEHEELTVALADRIWPRVDVQPDQGWIDLLARFHGVDVQPLDFLNDTAASRKIINDWVGDKTQGLIPELLPVGFIQRKTSGRTRPSNSTCCHGSRTSVLRRGTTR